MRTPPLDAAAGCCHAQAWQQVEAGTAPETPAAARTRSLLLSLLPGTQEEPAGCCCCCREQQCWGEGAAAPPQPPHPRKGCVPCVLPPTASQDCSRARRRLAAVGGSCNRRNRCPHNRRRRSRRSEECRVQGLTCRAENLGGRRAVEGVLLCSRFRWETGAETPHEESTLPSPAPSTSLPVLLTEAAVGVPAVPG